MNRMFRWMLGGAIATVAILGGGCSSGPVPEPINVHELEALPENNYIYRIAPGDEIQVDILQDEDYDWKTTVLPDGSATFRYAGDLDVMGLTLAETRSLLRENLKDYYNPNTLSMTLQLLRTNGPDPIIYLGNFGGGSGTGGTESQIGRGGVIPYRKGIGLMEVVALAGGPGEPDIDVTPYLYVVRNIKSLKDRKVYRFDLALAVRGGSVDLPIHPGDVLFLDQSWLQDLSRALGYVSRIVGTTSQGIGSALLVDYLGDGAFND